MRSLNSSRENTATHAGAVFMSTTASAAPLRSMASWREMKKEATPNAPKSTKHAPSRGVTRHSPRRTACRRKHRPPSASRQKATSPGWTPASKQKRESGPMTDHSPADSTASP